MIHTSVNVRAIWEYQVHGSAGLIEYLGKVLRAEGHVSSVKRVLAQPPPNRRVEAIDSTSIFVDSLWEVVIEDNPAPIHGGPSIDPMYTLWYHPIGGGEVHMGTVNNIALVMAVISSTTEFS